MKVSFIATGYLPKGEIYDFAMLLIFRKYTKIRIFAYMKSNYKLLPFSVNLSGF
jgi:hypothetical protein